MKFIAYDLGTGGVKASLFDQNFKTLSKTFNKYNTHYPQDNMHEQKPVDWWKAVVRSTKQLLEKTEVDSTNISCISLSGHSCVAVPLDKHLNPVLDSVPIWSDTRATEQTNVFFNRIDNENWYNKTGNGFPAACYYLFKLMWLKQNYPEEYRKIHKIVGSKDYINLKLTGNVYTDFSYASSSGAYDLNSKQMISEYLEAAEIREDIFPEIVSSHQIIGQITKQAAKEIGLHENVLVACGGVDNACMALGAVGSQEGSTYVSLGSSSWIPVNSKKPILDYRTKPYVFAHIEDNMFTSAYSIFAGGSSLEWAKNILCKDLPTESIYDRMSALASEVPIGSNGILFNPSLAGGTSQDKSINIHGAFLGLHLGTTREDLIRATMEGIALNLRTSLEYLSAHVTISDNILFCGGGSKSKVWMQMFADIFNLKIIKSNIDQDAASLGAAAICAKATGLWSDYTTIPELHFIENESNPTKSHSEKYNILYNYFKYASEFLADYGDYIKKHS